MVTTRSQGPPEAEAVETLPLRSRVDTGSNASPATQKRSRPTADDSRSPKRRKQVAADPAAQAEPGSTLESLGPNSNDAFHNKSPIVRLDLQPAVVGANAAPTTSTESVAPTNESLTQVPRNHGNLDLPDGIPEQPINESTLTRQTDAASMPPPPLSEILQVPASQNSSTRPAPKTRPRILHTRRPPEWALARLHPSSPAPRPRSTLEKYRRDTLGRRTRVSHWPGKKASFVQAR